MLHTDKESVDKIKAAAEANRKAGGWTERPDVPSTLVLDDVPEDAVPDPSDD